MAKFNLEKILKYHPYYPEVVLHTDMNFPLDDGVRITIPGHKFDEDKCSFVTDCNEGEETVFIISKQ